MTIATSIFTAITPEKRTAHDPRVGPAGKTSRASQFARPIAKAITWRVIGTTEIFAISLWTTGHIATAGHTAGIAAVTSVIMYVAHELAWSRHEVRGGKLVPRSLQIETGREPAVAGMSLGSTESASNLNSGAVP